MPKMFPLKIARAGEVAEDDSDESDLLYGVDQGNRPHGAAATCCS
jgi:hypothetical protein